MADIPLVPDDSDRLAKVIARAGLCSRREAEAWIAAGRVAVNGKLVKTPAFNVTERDKITVDKEPLAARQGTRVWMYHKPTGLVVTENDPEGRPTVFDTLAEQGLPRVVSIGRLDINTEGLLLLTNDGGLKRVLELPSTGWLRKYRVRAHGSVTQPQLDTLKVGVTVEGVKYGPIDAAFERQQGGNVWLLVALREGKNREVKNVLASLGLVVNRLIRVSYGPFQLGDLPIGAVEVVKARVLREQLGTRLATLAEVDFDSDLPEPMAATRGLANAKVRAAAPGKAPRAGGARSTAVAKFRFTDRAERTAAEEQAERGPRPDRPGGRFKAGPHSKRALEVVKADETETRQVFFNDGREPQTFVKKSYGKPGKDEKTGVTPDRPDRDGAERPKRAFGDKPRTGAAPVRRPREDGDRSGPPRSAARARPTGDRPEGRSFGGARPPRAGGDRPASGASERPKFSGPRSADSTGAERPKRSYGDAARTPRPDGDRPRPPRADGDRPRTPRGDMTTRPPRGDMTTRPPRGDFARPARSASPRPPRPEGERAPPRKTYGATEGAARKPYAKPEGAARKPYARPDGAAPRKPYAKPEGAGVRKPYAKPDGAAPRKPYAKPEGAAPRQPYAKADGAPRKPYVKRDGAAPRGPARGPGGGGKPRTPRPPKA